MNRKKVNSGVSLIEILIGMTISVMLFLFVTNIMAVLFTSTNKDKRLEDIEQVKNDLQTDLSNKIKWAGKVAYQGGVLTVDADSYRLDNDTLYKNDVPLTPASVKVTSMQVKKHTASISGASLGVGSGLIGEFYNDTSLTDHLVDAISATIDHDWDTDAPYNELDPDAFSVRWYGQIETRVSGSYNFRVRSHDGARLYINNTKLIDRWTNGALDRSGTISLEGGRRYSIVLEFLESGGVAYINLSWSGPGFGEEIIPKTQLYPVAPTDSIEISFDLAHAGSSLLTDTLKLVLSTHGGGIISVVE